MMATINEICLHLGSPIGTRLLQPKPGMQANLCTVHSWIPRYESNTSRSLPHRSDHTQAGQEGFHFLLC